MCGIWVKTQSNHVFASIYAFCKLQVISEAKAMNHFAIRAKMLLQANKAAFKEWLRLKMSKSQSNFSTA